MISSRKVFTAGRPIVLWITSAMISLLKADNGFLRHSVVVVLFCWTSKKMQTHLSAWKATDYWGVKWWIVSLYRTLLQVSRTRKSLHWFLTRDLQPGLIFRNSGPHNSSMKNSIHPCIGSLTRYHVPLTISCSRPRSSSGSSETSRSCLVSSL